MRTPLEMKITAFDLEERIRLARIRAAQSQNSPARPQPPVEETEEVPNAVEAQPSVGLTEQQRKMSDKLRRKQSK